MALYVVTSDAATIYLAVINSIQTIALAVIAAMSHRGRHRDNGAHRPASLRGKASKPPG